MNTQLQMVLAKRRALRRTSAANSRGMTLIEIMVVVAIISLVVGGVSVMAFNSLNAATIDTAYTETKTLQGAVEVYMTQKRQRCPKTLDDLKKAGVASKTEDPWGTEYAMKCPGDHGTVDITSAGPDREMGTEDDISNFKDPNAEPEES